ncbi:hypothetical protein CLAFUW4_05805 [Fulvia fulva]|uniref:Uncharacterized protein n=1 Tax=Passalora fulva TaxID=5499 RepID=A0A9Q8LI76_PASFU|nr:uncharacterized protein CLAFUR5_05946 [Fulvia fulva]KAK4623979.1 hypothetical protein CLAFUR4_05799 [Fulvia fulva]KAK4626030.1 hypothetical protein CLAFUR0_05810 [Fulvia fulva]UJO17960.1 hypothetical protein CLAFUR5_05946 [Fulvia fulva]WPV14718.1 hypothetical protein CLAFUW4_05805 [Fulvia fulva]WPV30001.1 hypothetical protein CLAFUW7_05803 [Fulvia fulva]
MARNTLTSGTSNRETASRRAAGRYLDLARGREVSDYERIHFLMTPGEEDEGDRPSPPPVTRQSRVQVIDLCGGSDEEDDEREDEKLPDKQTVFDGSVQAREQSLRSNKDVVVQQAPPPTLPVSKTRLPAHFYDGGRSLSQKTSGSLSTQHAQSARPLQGDRPTTVTTGKRRDEEDLDHGDHHFQPALRDPRSLGGHGKGMPRIAYTTTNSRPTQPHVASAAKVTVAGHAAQDAQPPQPSRKLWGGQGRKKRTNVLGPPSTTADTRGIARPSGTTSISSPRTEHSAPRATPASTSSIVLAHGTRPCRRPGERVVTDRSGRPFAAMRARVAPVQAMADNARSATSAASAYNGNRPAAGTRAGAVSRAATVPTQQAQPSQLSRALPAEQESRPAKKRKYFADLTGEDAGQEVVYKEISEDESRRFCGLPVKDKAYVNLV